MLERVALFSQLTPRRRCSSRETCCTRGLRPSETMEDVSGRMAQMEAMSQVLRNDNMTLQKQQQETVLQTATTGRAPRVQMERLMCVVADLMVVLSEASRVTLWDVKGVLKPSGFQKK